MSDGRLALAAIKQRLVEVDGWKWTANLDVIEKDLAFAESLAREVEELRGALDDLVEQLEALYWIAARVSEADNQRLAAEGEPGLQAMREMEDALAALHQFVDSRRRERS